MGFEIHRDAEKPSRSHARWNACRTGNLGQERTPLALPGAAAAHGAAKGRPQPQVLGRGPTRSRRSVTAPRVHWAPAFGPPLVQDWQIQGPGESDEAGRTHTGHLVAHLDCTHTHGPSPAACGRRRPEGSRSLVPREALGRGESHSLPPHTPYIPAAALQPDGG